MEGEFLNGRFENTAFCILAPDGKKRLSGTGRSPRQAFRVGRSSPDGQNAAVIEKIEEVTAKYPAKGRKADAVVQNFHSFKQALNIASGDQRLLVFVVAAKKERSGLKKSLQAVANHSDVIGRYHFDFADALDAKWSDVTEGNQHKTGIFIIRAGQFGQDGKVVAELSIPNLKS